MKQKIIKRKLLSFLLTLALVLGLVPWISLTAEADGTSIESNILFVNGTDMSTLSGSGYVLTCDSGTATLTGNSTDGYTLTLNNEAQITSGYQFNINPATTGKSAIYYAGTSSLTIEVNSNSTITGSYNDGHSYGIYSKGNLTISGSGTLTVTGGAAHNNSYGVYSAKALTVSGELKAYGGEATETGSSDSYGVYAWGNLKIDSNGKLTAVGGKSKQYSRGAAGANESGSNFTVYGYLAGTGGEAEKESSGVYSGKALSVSGDLNAIGGQETSNSYGVNARVTLTVQYGGKLVATAMAGSTNYGIYANSALTVQNGGTLSATAMFGSINNYGIYVNSASGTTVSEGIKNVVVTSATQAIYGIVKNSITGTGWTNMGESGTAIPVSSGGQSYDYKIIQFAPPAHTHSFTYTPNGATITATCSEDDCDLTNKQATLTITATGGTYDGTTPFSATVTNNIPAVEGDTVGSIEYYKVDTEGATTGGTLQASAPVNAGYYYANVTLTSGSNSYTAVKAFTIAKGTAEALDADSARTNSGINYQTEQATPSSGYQISTDNANPVESTPVSLTNILDGDTPTIYVRRTENDNQNAGAWVAVALVSRPDAPTPPATENATNDSTADGKIKGALATWEYKNKETGKEPTNWTPMTAGDVTVKSGTYQIRVKATNSAPHGKVTEVTVETAELAKIGNTPYTTLAAAIEAAQSGDTIELLKNVTISDTITLKPGITIDGNGKSITHTGGQVFVSQTGAPVTIKNLIIKESGQALEVPSGSTVILDGCTITQCSNDYYAAVHMSGTVVLYKTKISGNSSTASNAGGVIELGYGAKLFGIDSTISNNTAVGHTGGINNLSGSVYLMKCKVTGNSSNGTGNTSLGGGVRDGANFYAANCVIAGNYSGPNTSTDTLDIGGSPTLRNCIYGNLSSAYDATKVTGSTGGGSGSAPIPDGDGKRTECSYTVSDGQLNITMRYQDENGNMQDLWERPASSVTTEPSLVSGLTYTGSEQALVNGGTANGGTLVYAVGTNATTAPTEGWGSDIPKRTAAGTYYVWYKVRGDIDHSDSTAKCITVTIKSQGGGGGSTGSGGGTGGSSGGTESYTIPVTNENTVNVKTEITDGTAVVGEITQKDIDKIVDTGSSSGSGSENTSITIDISQAKSEVTSVELTKGTIEKLAEAVGANDNIKSVEIKMSDATVELDGTALAAISEQAQGSSIKLVVEGTNTSKLNESQQESLKQFASASPFEAYFESDGKRIHDFKGGTARVSLKFTPEAGRSLKHYHVYYLSLAGAIERFVTYFANGLLSFVTSHFSDYAIVYDEEMENGGEFNPEDPVDPVDPEDPEDPVKIMEMHRLYNPNSGEHFYTADVEERDYLVEVGWNYEGVAWYAPEESEIPVYRLYNSNAGDHHYTMDIEERDDLIAEGWNDEGIGWYSVETEDVPLYRVYNPNALEAGAHHYTADVDERDYLVVVGWSAEGIGWYGMNEEAKELMK